MLAPAANYKNTEYSDFYTGGGKRAQNNVDTRNMIAQAFLNKNTPFGLCNHPPAHNMMAYPPVEYRERGGSRSRSYSRRRRRYYSDYSDSSPSVSPERSRSKSGSRKRRREYKDDSKYSHSPNEEVGKSIVRID